MKKFSKLSDSELEIMQIIWDNNGSALFAEIAASLNKMKKSWKTNTVLSFLNRLAEKEVITIKKQGRLNEYIAVISQDSYRSEMTKIFVSKMYRGNVKSLICNLIKQDSFSDEDYNQIIDFWKDGSNIK